MPRLTGRVTDSFTECPVAPSEINNVLDYYRSVLPIIYNKVKEVGGHDIRTFGTLTEAAVLTTKLDGQQDEDEVTITFTLVYENMHQLTKGDIIAIVIADIAGNHSGFNYKIGREDTIDFRADNATEVISNAMAKDEESIKAVIEWINKKVQG